MRKISKHHIKLFLNSSLDRRGVLFEYKGEIFRAIFDPEIYKRLCKLLKTKSFLDLAEAGLIETESEEKFSLSGSAGVLRHKRIEFVNTIAEWTPTMLWKVAKMYIHLNRRLVDFGLTMLDCHPWNVIYQYNRPVMVDFGSVGFFNEARSFNDGLHCFFILPLWMQKHFGSMGAKFVNDFRREHILGMATSIVTSKKADYLPLDYYWLTRNYDKIMNGEDKKRKVQLLERMESYVDDLRPEVGSGYWSDYPGDLLNDKSKKLSEKQEVVLKLLKEKRGETLVDMGANKGWYAFAAANQGYRVVAFDYEEFNVDYMSECVAQTGVKLLPLQMNFLFPTPASGPALSFPDAFARLKADVSLVLGLTHHLTITQQATFLQVAHVVSNFTRKRSIVEFVPSDDKCLEGWQIPKQYSLTDFVDAMKIKGLVLKKKATLSNGRLILDFDKKS